MDCELQLPYTSFFTTTVRCAHGQSNLELGNRMYFPICAGRDSDECPLNQKEDK